MESHMNYQMIVQDQFVIPSILLKSYHQLKLSETEVMVILHIHRFQMEGNKFPTPEDIAQYTSISGQECTKILRTLIQKNILVIEQEENENKLLSECYSLEPLWVTLYKGDQSSQPPVQDTNDQQSNIFILFEQEFGRPLSPFEIETVNIWIDEEEQAPALIKAALREAVLMGKLNFRYIDRILREWKKKGIKSVEQARNQSKQFHANQSGQPDKQKQTTAARDVSLYYNWLEDE
ncbi:DnaD domain-containing protein [Sediminibacillus albus]|uniref:DNA replication protein n=1 Tax=Sediminibacillus albus TaxID=407036 RepID=A0A1G8VPV4_9BACI|nr:DnaD domain-containing protein [Sediminibacillus albus]SDJ67974.1 DNA replication protein [Sediminibacillus albus]